MTEQFSRRAVLLQIGAAGLAATIPGAALSQNRYVELDSRSWFFLTTSEARFLAAFSDVLIPEDEHPSASQAGVVDFIDLQLAGSFGQGDGLYMRAPFERGTPQQGYQSPLTPAQLIRQAIAALDAQETPLVDMDEAGREDLVTRLSEGDIDLGELHAKTVFGELHALTNEGYFADPVYGGNKDYAGWRMVGFPGAHAYYTDFIDKNVPYPAPPKGVAHIPGTGRSGSVYTAGPRPTKQEG